MRPRHVSSPVAMGLVLASCTAHVSLQPATPAGECLLLRDNDSGVIGMDVGGSVPLLGGQSLFIFGDTFLGRWNSDGSRSVSGAVHSSAAFVDNREMSSCFASSAFLSDAGAVVQFLSPTQDQAWPLGPALVDGGSIALLYTWVKGDSSQALGFDTLGNGIVVGSLAASVPVDVQALSAPATEGMPAAWLVRDGYAFLYRCGARSGQGLDPCVVGRAPIAAPTSLSAYQYYVAGQGYVGTYAQASVVGEGAPAFSITYNAYLSRYVQVYVEPFAPSVSVRTAPAPEGPFSDKHDVWRCSLPSDDPKAYCYAAFEHPQLDSTDGRRIVVTYSTNTTDFGSMIRHPNVYWPRLVTIDLADAGL